MIKNRFVRRGVVVTMFFDRKIGQVNDFMNLTSRRTIHPLLSLSPLSISTRRKCKNFDKYFQMETKHRDLHSFQQPENRFFCKARRIFRSHASRVRKRTEKKKEEREGGGGWWKEERNDEEDKMIIPRRNSN